MWYNIFENRRELNVYKQLCAIDSLLIFYAMFILNGNVRKQFLKLACEKTCLNENRVFLTRDRTMCRQKVKPDMFFLHFTGFTGLDKIWLDISSLSHLYIFLFRTSGFTPLDTSQSRIIDPLSDLWLRISRRKHYNITYDNLRDWKIERLKEHLRGTYFTSVFHGEQYSQ